MTRVLIVVITAVLIAIVLAIVGAFAAWLAMFWRLTHSDETPGWARHLIEAAANP